VSYKGKSQEFHGESEKKLPRQRQLAASPLFRSPPPEIAPQKIAPHEIAP
jgi:hypothetical protein